MARILGLDYGHKRVGIAVSDPMQLIACPLKTICTHEIVPFLQLYTNKENVEMMVVGWPLQLDGALGPATRLVAQFIRLLKRYFPHIPVVHYDERFTSILAEKSLKKKGFSKKQRQDKARLDMISATFILRSFMEKKRTMQSRR